MKLELTLVEGKLCGNLGRNSSRYDLEKLMPEPD
jgi:hypothetical protein